MELNEQLKKDMLTLTGSFRYLDTLLGLNTEMQFASQMMQLYATSHTLAQTREFARTCLLRHPDPAALLSGFDAREFLSQGSRLLADAIWLDEEFQKQNPAFGNLNADLLQKTELAFLDDPADRQLWKSASRTTLDDTENDVKALPWQSDQEEMGEANPDETNGLNQEAGQDKDKGKGNNNQENPEDGSLNPSNQVSSAQRVRFDTEENPDQAGIQKQALEQALAKLDAMTGLENVKQDIHSLVSLMEISRLRTSMGLKAPEVSRHLVFAGNPGTGKTTAARLLGQIYKAMGFLSKGQLVETDRSGLVAGYIGQTAIQTRKVIEKAIGGVLFIDEAYALSKNSANDFGQEAIEVLLRMMEEHRNDLVVVAAGYPEEMEQFLQSNPGLRSRFNTVLSFDNYSGPELMSILESMAASMDYTLDAAAKEKLSAYLQEQSEAAGREFGNGRTVRNLLEKALIQQADRLVALTKSSDSMAPLSKEELMMLTEQDFALS